MVRNGLFNGLKPCTPEQPAVFPFAVTWLKNTPTRPMPYTETAFAVQRKMEPHHVLCGIIAQLHRAPVRADNQPGRIFRRALAFTVAVAIPGLSNPTSSVSRAAIMTCLVTSALPWSGRARFGKSNANLNKLPGFRAGG